MVIMQEMGLDEKHCVMGLENWPLPDDTGLYVSLTYGSETVVGNSNYSGTDSDGNFTEVQDCAMLHGIEVDVLSFGIAARLQKEEVVQALASQYSQNLQELYNMRIANTPTSFTAISEVEPAKQLNRFRLTVLVNAIHRRVVTAGFFDSIQPVKLTEQP
jgi:hypothetical protein